MHRKTKTALPFWCLLQNNNWGNQGSLFGFSLCVRALLASIQMVTPCSSSPRLCDEFEKIAEKALTTPTDTQKLIELKVTNPNDCVTDPLGAVSYSAYNCLSQFSPLSCKDTDPSLYMFLFTPTNWNVSMAAINHLFSFLSISILPYWGSATLVYIVALCSHPGLH